MKKKIKDTLASAKYDHLKIEKKWQKEWEKKKTYKTKEGGDKPKAYVLDMFPYPSGTGLHVGHPRGYIATDSYSRYKTMNGYNVLHPMGWDAFGLPAEEFAIKNKIHPSIAVKTNVKRFKEQLSILGLNYDWSREVNTTDPEYYKWTQWAFLQMHKKGLTFESHEPINWCPSCKTGLANEDLEDGKCERCGSVVEQKPIRQWVIKITDYADRLLKDIDGLNWPESIKESQRNWIGRSEGAEVEFKIKNSEDIVKVFTTRIDTLFGVTYLVLAPESEFVARLNEQIENKSEVDAYIKSVKLKNTIERTAEGKEKTGVALKGVFAINPANNEEIPVWIADYVLGSYGTGCVMAVPAHDERDFQFAKKYKLPLKYVVAPYIKLTGEDAVKLNVETLDRNCIDAIIENDKGEFLFIEENANNIKHLHLVGGGVDNDETFEEAAIREVTEETGYSDIEIVRKMPIAVYSCGHRHTKKKNQNCFGYTYHIKVKSDKRVASEVEEGRHSLIWIKKDEALARVTWPHHAFMWQNFVEDKPFLEEGRIFDSENFSRLTSTEAKKAIAQKFGKEVVNYKLRDWVFSRQRYWGEPIPLIHCLSCAHDTYNSKEALTLSFYNKQVWDAIVSGKKTVETRALNPEEKATERYFGNVSAGDIIRLENKFDKKPGKNPKYVYILVKKTSNYSNISELFNDKDILNKANHWPTLSKSVKEHTARYATLAPKYDEKINTNGMVAWEFDLLSAVVPVPEKELPLKLPNVKSYEPTGTGESPLAAIDSWVNVKCPACKAPAKRETNTMPQWAGSCWYYLRFIDPKNKKALVDPKKEKYWQPVNMYVGGAEHATRHLIYARFWHKFLFDIGTVSTSEPFMQLKNQGLIGGPDGRKMSKRYGNVVNPDDIVKLYGADTLRVYEMFMGPFDAGIAWSTDNMIGSRRFIERTWRLFEKVQLKKSKDTIDISDAVAKSEKADLESLIHRTIKKVGEDIETFAHNTAISSLMILLNAFEKQIQVSKENYETFLKLLAPFAPHVTDELWTLCGNKNTIHHAPWPAYDLAKLQSSTFKIVVQINSKVRATVTVTDDSEAHVLEAVLKVDEIAKRLGNTKPDKVIYVKGKLVNLVVSGI